MSDRTRLYEAKLEKEADPLIVYRDGESRTYRMFSGGGTTDLTFYELVSLSASLARIVRDHSPWYDDEGNIVEA